MTGTEKFIEPEALARAFERLRAYHLVQHGCELGSDAHQQATSALAASAGVDDELVTGFRQGLDELTEGLTGATLPKLYRIAAYMGFLLALVAVQEQMEA
jgi:hypothetical protein